LLPGSCDGLFNSATASLGQCQVARGYRSLLTVSHGHDVQHTDSVPTVSDPVPCWDLQLSSLSERFSS